MTDVTCEVKNYRLEGLETARKDVEALAKSAAFFSKVEEWAGYKNAVDAALFRIDELIDWEKKNAGS